MLILIDGTGDWDDPTYERDFENSFLNRLRRNYTGSVRYWRGPWLVDVNSAETRGEVLSYLRSLGSAIHQVIIAGYSRGGAIAISVANYLHEHNLNPPALNNIGTFQIPLLLLFDAVNRSSTLENTEYIPPIVQNCLHAKRDPRVLSRWYFGNCASNPDPAVNYRETQFFCTHAGMGGTPWTGDFPTRLVVDPTSVHAPRGRGDSGFTYSSTPVATITQAQDVQNSERIRVWMNSKIQLAGLAGDNLVI